MNIFVLDRDPIVAAKMQCDKHVVKMIVETAQMLSTAVNELGGRAKYRSAYKNHPCTVWARQTLGNFLWLYDHGEALCAEYTFRYKKVHKSEAVISNCLHEVVSLPLHGLNITPLPLCMPDEYKQDCPVKAYRAYYQSEKAYFAKWNKGREEPFWWRAING